MIGSPHYWAFVVAIRRRLANAKHRPTEEELRAAEAYDAQWQIEDEFERLVQNAIDRVPAELRGYMSNVTIVVEDEPPPDANLLGLYQGIPLTSRGHGYTGTLPDKITIYRGPLERHYGHDPDRLADEVRRVVWHEIAHHFGISDQHLIEIDRY